MAKYGQRFAINTITCNSPTPRAHGGPSKHMTFTCERERGEAETQRIQISPTRPGPHGQSHAQIARLVGANGHRYKKQCLILF